MQIDPETGKVYYELYNSPIVTDKLKQSLEDLKITENLQDKVEEEPVFQKTRHYGLPYGRLKYLLYCFLLVADGMIGIVSLGQTQSILAQKYLLSKWLLCEVEEYEHRQDGR